MEFVNDPIKSKRVFILMLVLAIVFLICAAVFGYFSYSKNKENSDLRTQNDELQKSLESSASASDKTNSALTKENTTLKTQKAALEKEVKAYEDKISMITKYNEFLKYMTQVIDAHDGYVGWTDAEYQVGRQKAVATGNQDFVNDVDSAWNDTTIDPVTRALTVYYDIIAGIEAQTE